MIEKGNVTIMVADLDRSIKFYTETLGFKLGSRFGNMWAKRGETGFCRFQSG